MKDAQFLLSSHLKDEKIILFPVQDNDYCLSLWSSLQRQNGFFFVFENNYITVKEQKKCPLLTSVLFPAGGTKLPEISSLTHFPFSVAPLDFCSPAPIDSCHLYCISWPLPGLLQPGPCRGTMHFKLDLSFF